MATISAVPPDLRPGAPAAPRQAKPPVQPRLPAPKKTGNQVGLNPGLRGQDMTLMKYLASLFGPSKPAGSIGDEASSYVSGSINPLIGNLTAEARRQVEEGSKAIQGVYGEYANRMGAVGDTVRSDNAAAQAAEEKAGGSLRDYLSAAGAADGADVGSKVAGDAPAGSALALAGQEAGAGVGKLGAGIAGESAGRGYTGLSELIGHGAAAQGQADQLPGLARLEGLDTLHGFTGSVEGDLKQKTDALMAQIPGMTADIAQRLVQESDSSRNNKASLLGSFLTSALDRNTQAAIARAGLGTQTNAAAVDWTNSLGFKTDAQGNPVYDANGNLIPTAQATADKNSKKNAGADAHAKAVANLGDARQSAIATVRSFASTAMHPKPVKTQVPEVVAGVKTGKFVTKYVTPPAPTYQQVLQLAMKQPEVTVLETRYALKPDMVRQIVMQGLAAAGINPPKAKPPAAAAPPQLPVPSAPGLPFGA